MSDKPTQKNLDTRSFEERVFARFDALDARMNAMESNLNSRMDAIETRMGTIELRMSTLEEKVDRRLQETRPIWEAVQAQLEVLNTKIDVVITDFYNMRTNLVMIEKRVTNLEDRRAQ
jgi:chaperonin cofactor prefoldin